MVKITGKNNIMCIYYNTNEMTKKTELRMRLSNLRHCTEVE